MQIYEIWVSLSQDKEALVFTFFWTGWGMVVLLSIMRGIWGDKPGYSEYLSLALGGWVLPIFLLSLLILALGILLGIQFNLLTLLVLMFFSAGFATWTVNHKKNSSTFNFLFALFSAALLLFLVLLRLPFLTRTLLPPYFDSAQHFWIANILIKDYENTSLTGNFIWPVSSYYHLGYHIIVAGLTVTSHVKLDRMILVFGQIILAFAPVPLFFIPWRETRSYMAGLFAVILGTFGWYMPAHAVNWGKYPALLGILTSLFSLNLLYLFNAGNERPLNYRAFVGLIILGIFTSFLIHTRSIVLIGIGLLSWILAQRWERQSKMVRLLFLGLVLIGLTGEIVYVERNDVLNALLDPYLHDGVWITSTIGLLTVIAYSKYRRLVLACLLFILLLILCLFIPVSSNAFFTLMDRPFIEMALFIPLSIMGGLGFARIGELTLFQYRSLKVTVMVLLSGLIVFHAFMKYNFYPSDCCEIVGGDDLFALNWMDKNLPENALILIPSAEIKIAPSGDSPQNSGSDAGVWIAPLIGRSTISLPYNLDFGQTDTLNKICDRKIVYIYAGSTDQSFSSEPLEQKPDWYEMRLFLPNAKVYQVLGCA